MIKGIGTDIIEPARIEKAIENPRFIQRVYTQRERARIEEAGAFKAQRAAGIFAGKEAAVKALGCGFDGIAFCDVEVLSDERGAPQLLLRGGALERAESLGADRWFISISHIESAAVAFVVIEGEGT